MHIKKPIKNLNIIACIVLVSILNGCCSTNHNTDPDPLETFNRQAFAVNQKLDEVILKPIATVYTKITPAPIVTGISNGFDNLRMIPTIINDLLQGNIYQALQDNGRFMINSIIGIGGLIDVASHVGYPAHYTDFGITMAKWGYTDSPYLVLPLWGPTSVRDAIAIPVNTYMSLYPYITPFAARIGVLAGNTVSRRARVLEYSGLIDELTFEPYIFQRNAYLQSRMTMLAESKEKYDPWAKNHAHDVDEAYSVNNPNLVSQ